MSYFLVVVMCMLGECRSFWQDVPYVSLNECHTSSQQVVEYLSGQFPDSDGEIYCMTQAEFDQWKIDINNGGTPELRPDHPSKQPVQPQGTDA